MDTPESAVDGGLSPTPRPEVARRRAVPCRSVLPNAPLRAPTPRPEAMT